MLRFRFISFYDIHFGHVVVVGTHMQLAGSKPGGISLAHESSIAVASSGTKS